MSLQPVLINGEWRASDAVGEFAAVNPSTKTLLPDTYPVSSAAEVEVAIQAGYEAATALRTLSPDMIARFLETYANVIEARANALIDLAYTETALPPSPRLRDVELPRTTDQLRQAAAVARERSWCLATIDTQRGLRSMYGPLGGPVVVFGPNNFPFAFGSASGGDFVAAIAAGNPVIAKANTGHPGTTQLFAEAACEAIQATGMPGALVQLLYRTRPDVGFRLVSHPLIGATGFTGSRQAGLRLKEAADKAGKPIYLEMSSINPIFILPGALEERGEAIAAELYASCSMGVGQFCTKPGFVVVLHNASSEAFFDTMREHFQAPPGVLLGESGVRTIAHAVERLQANGAQLVTGGYEVEGPSYRYANTLLRISGDDFLQHPHELQIEAFGVVSLIVFARDIAQMQAITQALEGNLTGCLYTHTGGNDDALYAQIAPLLRTKVGRLLNDKMPTGVTVSPAMNHGGPYPATGHPGFTAVGVPAALLRFGALHSYDNVRPHRLPPELQDKNPTGAMWRLIDGVWTQKDIV
ncbi:MAG TPA: aldehyde dehydrogenase (NADP(+)) [Anaerolineae bacterium]|nr:aldehyde dehydrogenase (NADP(+)) [Anaerolineae bacterium]HQH39616.1 aldehyde dehydrogenase (NADP(+)) [Anaerolineae bacterium]